jgi:polyphenol oxidase
MRDVTLSPDPSGLWASIDVFPSATPRAGISLLSAGDMAISRRHQSPHRVRLLEAADCTGRVYGLRQVHSQVVVAVADQDPEDVASTEADGLITHLAGITLTITVADCLPLFLVDPVTGARGLLHSGWKGTGIVSAALSLMSSRFGTRVADVVATVGPGIGPCCYRVAEDRAALFAGRFGTETVAHGPEGDPRLDLRAANVALLRVAGVSSIGVVAECTCCSPRLGSFRRQGPDAYTLMCAFLTGLPGRTGTGAGLSAARAHQAR